MNACCSNAAFLESTEGLFFIGKLQRTIKLVWIKTDEYLNFSFPEGPVAHKDSTAIIMQCPCQYLTSTSTTFIHLLTDTGKLKLGEPLQFVCSLKDFSKKKIKWLHWVHPGSQEMLQGESLETCQLGRY